MKNSKDYINDTDLDFDTEDNRAYYETRLSETINKARKDIIDEIIQMYVPDGSPETWLNKINKLRDAIF